MKDAQPKAIQLSDYQPPNYWVDTTHLKFELHDHFTIVTSKLTVRHNSERPRVLELQGCDLELLSLSVNDSVLDASRYTVVDELLSISDMEKEAVVTVVSRIFPDKNTALEGLYRSGGMYCTQCEAEGFRRITYYPDRPDVMSVFTTEIIADAEKYPTLLSNGNPVSESIVDGMKHVVWHDPHKKPAYLFALVAGDLQVKKDQFVTQSGRDVELRIYVEPQNINKTDYALDALKRSMKWDEDVYGREYDLDLFMIVAVDDFNMGAMENKGLNIFNSSCVLASPESATDMTYQRIEAIVAHEYFHNWSGNRVTCRDWFQLSLKEGFTVFRDAQFSADMNSKTVKRIEDAKIMRTVQFAEDGGPMAHPVQPDSYIEISNFYTVTIYEKGAEVVGMLHRILGSEGFRSGSDLYFSRHDGQAVTIHDFVDAMADANEIDLSLFKRWYKQAGTPVVTVTSTFDEKNKEICLEISQQTPDTPNQKNKLPLLIPIKLGVLNESGDEERIQVSGGVSWNAEQQLLLVDQAKQTIKLSNIACKNPVVSIFRDFSAPVKVEFNQSKEDLIALLAHDSDGFNRWDAGQRLMLSWVARSEDQGEFLLENDEVIALKKVLMSSELDPAMISYCLTVPSESYIAETRDTVDPVSIHHARERVVVSIAEHLYDDLLDRYQSLENSNHYQPDPDQMRCRALRNLCLHYMSRIREEGVVLAHQQFTNATNMTDQMAALTALINSNDSDCADTALSDFYQQWKNDALVINQWLAVQAGSSRIISVEGVENLLNHDVFDWRNPNKVRSVLGSFSGQALVHFHNHSGSGYRLLADAVIKLNETNPQIAARLLAPLTKWRRLMPTLSQKMKQELQHILTTGNLSKDVYEVVSKSLAE